MALIPDKDQATIRAHFDERLESDVEIVMLTERPSPIIILGKQTCETCEDTESLLKEVVALSDKLKLTVHDVGISNDEAVKLGIDRVPAFVLNGASRGKVRFFGIPSGYEFSALIADVVDVSRGVTDLADETRDYLATLTEDVNIKVFTTPT
jgi:alkyl hydroperoxide reductase subunit AhpF